MSRKLVGDRTEPTAFRHLAEKQQGYDAKIRFRFIDGRMRSLNYAYLVETDYDPAQGIILQFVSRKVTIAGRNLVGLYHGLEDGAVGELVEQHANDLAVAESDPFISKIIWEQH